MSTREDKEGPNRLRRINTRRSLSCKEANNSKRNLFEGRSGEYTGNFKRAEQIKAQIDHLSRRKDINDVNGTDTREGKLNTGIKACREK